MKVPTLTSTRTDTPDTTRAYAQPRVPAAAFGTQIGDALNRFGAVLQARKEKEQQLGVRKLVSEEATALQLDFHRRQQEAPLGAEGFTEATLGDYTMRHGEMLNDLRERGYSEEAINEMDFRLTGMRDNIVGQALRFQDQSWQTKVMADLEETGMNLTQLAAMNPYDADAAIEELNASVDEFDDLTAPQREELKRKNSKAIRLAAGLGLAAQDPQHVVANLRTSGGFRDRLKHRESGGRASIVNTLGYAGLYQFGAPRLAALGMYTPGASEDFRGWSKSGKNAPGKWSGAFRIPGHPEVRTLDDFLNSPAAQETAMDASERLMEREISRRGLDAYIGKTVGGVTITLDGIKGMMHLGGEGGAERALKGKDSADAYGSTVLSYAKLGLGGVGGLPKDGKTGDPVLDALDAGERLQVLGHAQTALNQSNAQARSELDVVRNNATSAYLTEGEYTGPEPSREDFTRVYGSVAGEQYWSQYESTREAGKFVVGMRTASAGEIARQLEALRPNDTSSPTYATDLAVYEKAVQARDNVLRQRKDDPAAYVQTAFPQIQDAWNTDIAQGFAMMNEAYNQLNITPSERMPMTSGQVTRMQDNFAMMTPEQKVTELVQWKNTMGPLYQNGLTQLAKGGMLVEAYLSGLVSESPMHATTAANVLRGMQIIEEPSRRPASEQINDNFRAVMGDALRAISPTAADAMNKAATALYIFNGGDPKIINTAEYDKALREVVGGDADNPDTGIVDVGRAARLWGSYGGGLSSYKTILPAGVTGTQFRNWIDGISEDDLTEFGNGIPTYDQGTPVTANDIVREGEFVRVGTDEYIVVMGADGLPLRKGETEEYYRIKLTAETVVGDLNALP